MQPLAAEVIQI